MIKNGLLLLCALFFFLSHLLLLIAEKKSSCLIFPGFLSTGSLLVDGRKLSAWNLSDLIKITTVSHLLS